MINLRKLRQLLPPHLEAPWHYFNWKNPARDADTELLMAKLIHRRGYWAMMLLHWGIVNHFEGRISFTFFFKYNYPLVLLAPAIVYGIFTSPAAEWVALATMALMIWFVGWLYSSARQFGWMLELTTRIPPMGKA
jgi:hypothetical protein